MARDPVAIRTKLQHAHDGPLVPEEHLHCRGEARSQFAERTERTDWLAGSAPTRRAASIAQSTRLLLSSDLQDLDHLVAYYICILSICRRLVVLGYHVRATFFP